MKLGVNIFVIWVRNLKILLAITVFTLLALLIFTNKAQAASLNVVSGTDGINENGQCQLSEAIQNINDQMQTNNDCIAGDGNNDTISLPTGTITLTADTPFITKAITIDGQGMDSSIISGNNGQYKLSIIDLATTGEFNISDVTITGFKEYGIGIANLEVVTNVNITKVEIDGNNSIKGDYSLIGILLCVDGTINLNGVYVNNIAANGVNAVAGINVFAEGQSTADININNSTISELSSNDSMITGIGFVTGLLTGSLTPGTINANIENSTITGLSSNSSGAYGVSQVGVVNGGTTDITVDLHNNTINDISGGGGDAALMMNGAALGANDISNTDINATNNLITDSGNGCLLNGDIAQAIGSPDPSAGSINQSITSNGGNITDDASCNSYFTDPTDQTEVNPADLHLGTLGNYGGSIPTIPLEEGSIAIDSGVSVAGLTTDARGVLRPQCNSNDSGAYEYNGSCPVVDNPPTPPTPPPSSNTSQLTTPTSPIANFSLKPVSLTTPTGTTINSSSTVPESSLVTQDNNNQYPLGLVNFSFTTNQSSNQVVLNFETDLKPNQVTARKYNSNTNTYNNLPISANPTITETTINNKHHLTLTYTLIDNGELDLDPTTGIIKDPVGLAVTNSTYNQLANTGANNTLPIATAISMVTIASGSWILSRRRKGYSILG